MCSDPWDINNIYFPNFNAYRLVRNLKSFSKDPIEKMLFSVAGVYIPAAGGGGAGPGFAPGFGQGAGAGPVGGFGAGLGTGIRPGVDIGTGPGPGGLGTGFFPGSAAGAGPGGALGTGPGTGMSPGAGGDKYFLLMSRKYASLKFKAQLTKIFVWQLNVNLKSCLNLMNLQNVILKILPFLHW